MTPSRSRIVFVVPFAALLLSSACGDDSSPAADESPDASQPLLDGGGTSTKEHDAGAADTSTSQPPADAATATVSPKPACTLLNASEVAAILGVAQNATELLSGMQCQFASADPERKSVRGLLEVVTNGRAIYEANLRMYSQVGMTAVPQSGIGDQAAFISESVGRSSMISTRGDVLLRLNLGWGDPGTDSATQLAGERSLMLKAIERL